MLTDDEAEEPPFSPDVTVEVRSPGDDLEYLSRKIARYLATGTVLVLDVDPRERTVTAYSAQGVNIFREGDRCETSAVEWFSFDVTALFTAAQRRGS